MNRFLYAFLSLAACGGGAAVPPPSPPPEPPSCVALSEVTGYQCSARCFQPRPGQLGELPCRTFAAGGGEMLMVAACAACPRLAVGPCARPAELPAGEPCPGTEHCLRATNARPTEGFYCLWGEDAVVRDDCGQCPDFSL